MNEEHVGEIFFDSGQLIVGDPCYITKMDYDELIGFWTYEDPDDGGVKLIKEGLAVNVVRFGGDITAQVYVTKDSNGMVKSVRIDFDNEGF